MVLVEVPGIPGIAVRLVPGVAFLRDYREGVPMSRSLIVFCTVA
jgi:hypothetical protein